MIRELKESDIDNIMNIWLETNISSHDFIPENYWKENYDFVKDVLPDATVFIYEENYVIRGFIGIVDESYIAGLFVSKKYQNEGIGTKLLEKCREDYPILKLDVYAKNLNAIRFYKKHRFKIEVEKENIETKEIEYSMTWEDIY